MGRPYLEGVLDAVHYVDVGRPYLEGVLDAVHYVDGQTVP